MTELIDTLHRFDAALNQNAPKIGDVVEVLIC